MRPGKMKASAAAAGVPTAPAARKPTNLVFMLSVGLLATYKMINKKYYGETTKKEEPGKLQVVSGPGGKFNEGYDNEEGEYIVTPGEFLGYDKNFQVVEKVGNGQFGQVVKAWDKLRRCSVAIKIIKNKKVFLDQAHHEIQILGNLQKFAKSNEGVLGLTLDAVRNVAEQLLKALSILEEGEVIHCDVKPENVLLCDPEHSYVKLIDFGSSCFVGKTMYTYVQSRFYRAPEVILQLPYGTPIDMWSLGCVLIELHIGEPIFNGSTQAKQLGRFFELLTPALQVLGELPTHMVEAAPRKVQERYFETYTPSTPAADVSVIAPSSAAVGATRFRLRRDCIRTGDTQFRRRRIEDILGAATGGPDGRFAREPHHSAADYSQFLSLVLGLLQYDPVKRVRASEGLKHPFITMSYRGGAPASASGASLSGASAGAASGPGTPVASLSGTSGDALAGSRSGSKVLAATVTTTAAPTRS